MHLESGPPGHYCVTSIIAPLEAYCPLGVGGQLVYGLALAFIPPLGSEHNAGRHRSDRQYRGRINALADDETEF